MNVSLPEPLKKFVEGEVAEGGYTSASEFVRELLRKAQKRKAEHARLEKLLVEGLNSDPIEMDSEELADIRREFRERVARRNGE